MNLELSLPFEAGSGFGAWASMQPIGAGLTIAIGQDRGVAEKTATDTGDPINDMYLNVGIVDRDEGAFVATVWLPVADDPSIVQVSLGGCDMPIRPVIFRTLVRLCFVDLRASLLIVTAGNRDVVQNCVLHRLGFRLIAIQPDRIFYAIEARDLRPALRRIVTRSMH